MSIEKQHIFGLAFLILTVFGQYSVAGSPQVQSKEAPSAVPEDKMETKLIQIGDDAIHANDYATFLQRHPEIVARSSKGEDGKRDALREMVTAYLLRSSLYEEGLLSKEDKEPQPKQVSAAYDKLAEKHFPRPPVPDEKELYAYYEAHPGEFGIPAMTRLSQIEFRYKQGADAAVVEATRQRAAKALSRLEGGEAFDALAQAVTENPIGKVTKGDIGFVDFRESPWMQPHVEKLKVGERSGIIASPEGFDILLVTDHRPALISPYANVREKVSRNLRDAEQNKLRMAYVKEVSKKFKITILRDDLKALFPKGIYED